jgi:hypothetical protein
VLQRVLRDFIESPMYPKREANRRRDADSGRIVGNPYLISLRQSCPLFIIYPLLDRVD